MYITDITDELAAIWEQYNAPGMDRKQRRELKNIYNQKAAWYNQFAGFACLKLIA